MVAQGRRISSWGSVAEYVVRNSKVPVLTVRLVDE
jgi:nucleotide-binding universal stress UspA family protein